MPFYFFITQSGSNPFGVTHTGNTTNRPLLYCCDFICRQAHSHVGLVTLSLDLDHTESKSSFFSTLNNSQTSTQRTRFKLQRQFSPFNEPQTMHSFLVFAL